MSVSKFLVYSSFFFCVLVVSCKKQAPPEVTTKPKSEFPYAMLPREDTLPRLSKNFIDEKNARIDAFIRKNWSSSFENLSFLVAKNGQIIYEKYEGFADKSKGTLIDSQTSIHIASVSKVITASAILKLIDSKKIGLDDFVIKYLDRFPYPNVTIKTLLNHRSGIKKYGYFADEKANWGRNKTLTNAAILKILIEKKIPLEYKPDTHFSYCNTNYALLALVIEKVTKMKYKDAMQKIIFEPLHMNNTYVVDENTDRENVTPSYRYNYQKFPVDFLDAVYGDKNIYSTPRDLLKFDLARNAPNFLSKNLRNQVFKGYSYESKGTRNYGLGIRLHEWESGQKFFYHNGWWHGNTSSYNTLSKENVIIIALSNKMTTKTYKVKNLAVLFGDYPFKLNDDTSL